jgi:hypothetical protein
MILKILAGLHIQDSLPNLAVVQADFHDNLPDRQSIILYFVDIEHIGQVKIFFRQPVSTLYSSDGQVVQVFMYSDGGLQSILMLMRCLMGLRRSSNLYTMLAVQSILILMDVSAGSALGLAYSFLTFWNFLRSAAVTRSAGSVVSRRRCRYGVLPGERVTPGVLLNRSRDFSRLFRSSEFLGFSAVFTVGVERANLAPIPVAGDGDGDDCRCWVVIFRLLRRADALRRGVCFSREKSGRRRGVNGFRSVGEARV